MIWLIIFWTAFLAVAYTYIIYPIGLFILKSIQGSKKDYSIDDQETPLVSMVIAAYNEESCIEQKLTNTFNLDYPSHKLQVVVITDGSDDGTCDIVRSISGVIHLHNTGRKGKTAALNRSMNYVNGEYIIFTDANAMLNRDAIKSIIAPFQDSHVGVVAGEKKVINIDDDGIQSDGEGLYWKYESKLKQWDDQWYSTIGAAGELFAIRKKLYQHLPEDTILDDFEQCLRINMRGYKTAYAPGAVASESGSIDLTAEFERKVRISAGAYQAMSRLMPLFNPIKYGRLSIQYISHRVLRWTVAPFALIVMLFLNTVVSFKFGGVYTFLMAAQTIFYLVVLAGYLLRNEKVRIKGFNAPFYFIFMNVTAIVGLFRFINKKQPVCWEKVGRQSLIKVD